MNGKPSFYQQHVRITLDQPKQSSRRGNVTTSSGSKDGKLSLSIHEGPNTETALRAWQDSDRVKLETQMAEVAVEIVLTAEIRYRERAIHQYQWRVERKAELEEEERQRKFEFEHAEKKQQKKDRTGSNRSPSQGRGAFLRHRRLLALRCSRRSCLGSTRDATNLLGARSVGHSASAFCKPIK
jgi:hypothetical protein